MCLLIPDVPGFPTLCYIGNHVYERMELISPTDFAKEKVLAVQDYAPLAGRSLANIFPIRVIWATRSASRPHRCRIIANRSVGRFFHRRGPRTKHLLHLEQFGSISLTGQLVSLSMVRELGPVLTGLMVAGRNSSGMASELGSMKVTEQIDAMRALGTDPTKKLVTPRVISTILMLFFLTIISDLLGLTGGFVMSWLFLGLDASQYWTTAYQTLVFQDVVMGLASRSSSASLSLPSAVSMECRPPVEPRAWAAPPRKPW